MIERPETYERAMDMVRQVEHFTGESLANVCDIMAGKLVNTMYFERLDFDAVEEVMFRLFHTEEGPVRLGEDLTREESFTQEEFVTFLVQKHRLYQKLRVYCACIRHVSNANMDIVIDKIFITICLLIQQILLFKDVSEVASSYLATYAKQELEADYDNMTYTSFVSRGWGCLISADEQAETYISERLRSLVD